MSWRTRILTTSRNRLITYYLVAILVTVAVYTGTYQVAVGVFEGREPNLAQSLQIVVQSLTTTGYGEGAPWASLELNLLVIAMQLTGIVLLFTALPVIALPVIQEMLASRAPTTIPATNDHVVICSGDDSGETLVDDLVAENVEYVIVESDRARATDLYDADYDVVHGDPQTVEGLERVHVEDAAWVVVESAGEVNPSIVLTAKAAAPDVPVVSVAEELDRAEYHRYAGADRVFSPRDSVGERLGEKATATVTADLDETVEIGDDFEIAELAIHAGSDLVGKRLEDARIRERTGANVIGAWIDGEFRVPPIEEPIDEHTVLLVTGRERQCAALYDLTLSTARSHGATGSVVVAGHGETGSAAVEQLADAGIEPTILDRVEGPEVDVCGDATDPDALRAAGIESAGSLILAIESDAETILATLVARELSDDVEIIARADDRESVGKIYRAGADYVLSLSRVTGRLLAATVLDQELLAFESQVKVVRTPAFHLAGQTIAGARIRSRTGCTVIGVERNGDLITGPDPGFRLESDDEVIVAGTDEGIAQFRELAYTDGHNTFRQVSTDRDISAPGS